jgi:hypothetical protein
MCDVLTKTKRPARAEWGWPLAVWRGGPLRLLLRWFAGDVGGCF